MILKKGSRLVIMSFVIFTTVSFSLTTGVYGFEEGAPAICAYGRISAYTCVEDFLTGPLFIIMVSVPAAVAAAVIILRRIRKTRSMTH